MRGASTSPSPRRRRRSACRPGSRCCSPLRAHTLSALYYPDGVDAGLVKAVAQEGVVVAGGLYPTLKTKYFRVGHMGAVSMNDVAATVAAIERALAAVRKR